MKERLGPSDGEADDPSGTARKPLRPRLRRLAGLADTPTVKRLAVGRMGRAIALSLGVIALLIVGGSTVSRSLMAWLHRQPDYRLRFVEIETEPVVPPWIRGGREALLGEIRQDGKPLAALSALDLNLDELRNAFRLNPWIAAADRVVRAYPNRVRVFVTFREPVARVAVDHRGPAFVDREGKVLPADGVDVAKIDLPVTINADEPPTEPRPGLDWPRVERDDLRQWPARSRMRHAAELAAFLGRRIREERGQANVPRAASIYPDHPGPGSLVKFDDRLFVLWDRDDGRGGSDGPPEGEKWRRLLRLDRTLKAGEYLEFTTEGIRVRAFDTTERGSRAP